MIPTLYLDKASSNKLSRVRISLLTNRKKRIKDRLIRKSACKCGIEWDRTMNKCNAEKLWILAVIPSSRWMTRQKCCSKLKSHSKVSALKCSHIKRSRCNHNLILRWSAADRCSIKRNPNRIKRPSKLKVKMQRSNLVLRVSKRESNKLIRKSSREDLTWMILLIRLMPWKAIRKEMKTKKQSLTINSNRRLKLNLNQLNQFSRISNLNRNKLNKDSYQLL